MKKKKARLIIVDDDADDRMLCQEYFVNEEHDHEVVILTSGEELFQYLDKSHAAGLPNLVLLDYNMPKMTGGEVLLQLRRQARYASLKVALYSSGMSQELQQCLAGLQVLYCFQKPVSVEEFNRMHETINNFLNTQRVYTA
jgi:CheY-like chemotaxis protein